MRKLVPIKNSVVCRKISAEDGIVSDNNVLIKRKNVDIYEILSFSKDDDIEFGFNVGDHVMSTSTGDKIEINEGEIVYLFKIEHIMCKVED